MNGVIVHHVLRTHGLIRDVYTWRCPACAARVSTLDPHTTSVYARRHECPPEEAA